jgi:hypothetical protein
MNWAVQRSIGWNPQTRRWISPTERESLHARTEYLDYELPIGAGSVGSRIGQRLNDVREAREVIALLAIRDRLLIGLPHFANAAPESNKILLSYVTTSAGRRLAGVNRQLSGESPFVGRPRFTAGEIGC